MSIHLQRQDWIQGATPPTGRTPDFIGQIYIDVSTTPKTVYFATSINPDSGWQAISNGGHTHEAFQITDLDTTIQNYIQENGIQAAIVAMLGNSNIWEGPINNFTGSLRSKGYEVLTKNSKLDDLADVDLVANPVTSNASVFGWTGSAWGAVEVTGVTPSSGSLDFSNFLLKSDVANDLVTNDPAKPLSAAQGVAIKALLETDYAKTTHTHSEYALANHKHEGYFDKSITEVLYNGIEFQNVDTPFYMTSSKGDVLSLNLSETQLDGTSRHSLKVDGQGGEKIDLYIGGASDAPADTLTLNFDTVHIPSGRIVTDSESGRILFPPIKIENGDTQYVANSSEREYGVHLNNSAAVGVGQVVFAHAARTRADGLLFPRSIAGNTQPSDIGQYNYMYILDDALVTDAAFTSTKNYIELNGRRIFFSATEPGRDARPGDILIKL